MPVQSSEFDNGYNIGETKALIAPLVQQRAENIDGYIIITVGHKDGVPTLGIISNDEHLECRIGLLAKAIELSAGEIHNA